MFDASKLLNQMLGAGSFGSGGSGSDKGPLGDVGGLLGSVFAQAVAGVKEGAADLDKATGIGGKANSAIRDATGKSPEQLFEEVKAAALQNKLAAGAALGGLGALLLGSRTGRGMAGSAVKLGGLALVGGLAYKAWKTHQAGQKPDAPGQLEAPPADSAFGATGDASRDQATSLLIIRAMIAAASCDGLVDNEERSRIVGGLEQAGLDVQAAKFLDDEFANPASVSDLVKGATTPELAVQVYTAARIAIDQPSLKERAFLLQLAASLNLTEAQVAHIDSAADAAKQ